jgi:hypothetical protein
LAHIPQIKQALGIQGIQTRSSAWLSSDKNEKAQIDLLIDRRDHVINICEMKFSIKPFQIDKKYANELSQKLDIFRKQTKTNKALFLTFVTTFGVEQNNYANALVQNHVTMNNLFE